ncbi:flagellar export chaperone FliS [Massilia sp. Dwa41.01b]|uniref:flagellar export chaperone FliS n=1 Tax=unclassified Massilia TaxID=2609279 RepID=UPI0015FF2A60|nr:MULTISPECIES: flagellar export chaperone FliS [unclassified Massilia]QNA90067.1 flagellar export chaperone FliS [Massilia sp. Dwa41.01b]QNB00955.1 flagellar export chaperone FliS [Massilia sp. Se16.2.3]
MFGSMQRGVNAYAKVGLETSVISASPHKLIVMLYDGALVAVKSAANHMAAGHIAERGAAISKALDIINNGLRASLDKKAGGDIARNLDALYVYMTERLLMANLQNKAALLDEVQTLLTDLRDAWTQIGEKPAAPADAMSQYPVMASA